MHPNAHHHHKVGALALMQMGYRDYDEIARLLGATAAEIEQIDLSDTPQIRAWAKCGPPLGEYAELLTPIRCNGCGARINKAPCLVCQLRKRGYEFV